MRNSIWCPKPLKDITLDDAIRIIDGVDSFTAEGLVKTERRVEYPKGAIRALRVLQDRGDERPEVLQHKEVQGKYLDCDPETLISWIQHVFRLEWSGVGGVERCGFVFCIFLWYIQNISVVYSLKNINNE
jgi:hypothetical protein